MVTFTPVVCNFVFLKFFVVGAEHIRPTGKPQEIIKSVEIDKRNRIVELLGKVCLCSHPLSPPLCCFFRYAAKILFLKKMLPLCLNKNRLALFLYCLPLRPSSSLGCLHFFSQQNLLKVICKINQL